MLLHEAVKKARKDLGLSQDKLSELAGIQRRQLAKLEAGGNVTLATLRKVLSQLPNLETFTIDAVTATVRRKVPAKEKEKAIASAMDLMLGAVQSLVTAMGDGKLPEESEMTGIEEASEVLYNGLGYSPEDLERHRQAISAESPPEEPQVPLTPEAAAEAYAALMEVVRQPGVAEAMREMGIVLPEAGESAESEDEDTGS